MMKYRHGTMSNLEWNFGISDEFEWGSPYDHVAKFGI